MTHPTLRRHPGGTNERSADSSPADRPASLAGALRNDLRPHHDRLERRLSLPGAIAGPADYDQLLEMWTAVWATVSTSVAASVARPGQELAALAARSGLALALDRSELRARCSVGHDRRSPQSAVGVARDAASLWGTAYVLRGSALGNRYLHPLIAARLTDVPASAFRYLSASGAQTRREWNDFCRRLDEWSGPASPEELHRTGVAAAAAFALVGSVADRIGWPPATGLPADGAAS